MHRLPDQQDLPGWTAARKPPPEACPRQFCFHFVRAGARFAPGLHRRLDEAVTAADVVAGDQCGWSGGRCVRLGVAGADGDWYEPHEPELERAGLPWFFFIPDSSHLVQELRARYLAEAAALWGSEP